jgi:hypothetical protein
VGGDKISTPEGGVKVNSESSRLVSICIWENVILVRFSNRS